MGNWTPVMRKEYAQTIRWRGLWVLTLITILITIYGFGDVGGLNQPGPFLDNAIGENPLIPAVQVSVTIVFSLTVLLVAYRALIGPPTDRSLTLVAAQPHTRGEILTGTILGRTTAIWTALATVLIITGTVSIVNHGFFKPIQFLLAIVAILLYTLVLATFATSISTVLNSQTTAAILISVYYIIITRGWESLTAPLIYTQLGGHFSRKPVPESIPLFLLLRSVPVDAFDVLINTILGQANAVALAAWTAKNPFGDPHGVLAVQDAFETTPLPLNPWMSVLVLLLWGLIPLTIAYHRFNTTNLA